MNFCPKCDTKMRKASGRLECPKCRHVQDEEARSRAAPAASAAAQGSADFNVLEGSEGKEALPTIEIACESCGHGEAVWWMLQTRSADEPTTQFYRCTSCGHTWRNYA